MAVPDDEALIAAAGRGDREAFSRLVDRHYRTILRFAARFLGGADSGAAEDLAQDVFLSAWRAAPGYRPRPGIRVVSWLLRIAANRCLNVRRGARLRAALSIDPVAPAGPTAPAAERPEARVEDRERAEAVRRAVDALAPAQRAAILLRHFDGLSYAEIAGALGSTVPAVESLLFRARQALGESLGPDATEGVSS
jgi:RNA polymerase sigma-70 factor (ECF subfamily)